MGSGVVPVGEALPKTMRALAKAEPGPGFRLIEAPVPPCGPRDVLIAVERAGICGTDQHIYEWDAWAAGRVRPGRIIGHEFMGHVAAVGAAVRNVVLGQRVSGEGHIGCGRCYCCRTGQGHICDRVDIIGIDVDGCFADYVRLPEENVWPLRPEVSDEAAALSDPLGNAMHTVMVDSVAGRTVLVMGAGAIGLLITAIAHAAGALDVVTLDVNPRKLAMARAMGADAVCDARDAEAAMALLDRTRDGRGFDVLLEASGSAAGIHLGLRLLRSGGWVGLLGLPPGEVALNLAEEVIFKGITVHGVNGRKMFETWYQVEDFVTHGRVQPERIVSHRFPLERYEEAFAALRSGAAVKVLLEVAPVHGPR
jgi:threonine 3-dehydrogenase